ncbi:hypothetical protein BN1843_29000 [Escherichia coli]|nr:hypothetical protein BN1843_29000 [Escherichia coli]
MAQVKQQITLDDEHNTFLALKSVKGHKNVVKKKKLKKYAWTGITTQF